MLPQGEKLNESEQEHEHTCVSARRIQTLKAIVLADGRESYASPIAGQLLHVAHDCHLNSRAFLLSLC